jgi:cellulose synthase/poly-beta-1,6-N-acetylglucosamine synthase-like glycosyltransferase
LNAGIATASGEILFLTDVRQTIEPQSLRALVSNFADPEVAAVSGHLKIRAGDGGTEEDVGAYRRFETWLRDRLAALDSIFGATGAIYAMRRDLAVTLPEDLLLDDMYLPLAAFRRGYRLVVDASAVAWDEPTDRDAEFGRKVRTLAGNYQLLMHCPWLLGPENRLAFHYWSYKAGRLLLPHLLLAMFVSAWFLPDLLRVLVLGGFVLAAALIVLDPWLSGAVKKLSSPLRTLAVMLWATVLGLQVLFRPPRSLWKVTGATAAASAPDTTRSGA